MSRQDSVWFNRISVIATAIMLIPTVFMACFMCQQNQLVDLALRADNRPDLVLQYVANEVDPASQGGIRVTNCGKGPALLLSLWMGGSPEPFPVGMNDLYVPANGDVDPNDKRLVGIIQETINGRKMEQIGWKFDSDFPAWPFSLVFRDQLNNVYCTDFLYQPKPEAKNMRVWQKGYWPIGEFDSNDACAKKLFRNSKPYEEMRKLEAQQSPNGILVSPPRGANSIDPPIRGQQ